jgi:hypothetical protein
LNIITKFGLVSVVRKHEFFTDAACFLVRSSNEGAIANFTDEPIIENSSADYRYRAFLTSEEFDIFLLRAKNSIDYENFKDSISDDNVHKLVYETWLSRKRLYE